MDSSRHGLRGHVIQSGVFLTVRHGLGMVLSLAGMLLLTRRIGPTAYGVYAGGLGILVFLQSLAQWGVSAYLLRTREEDLERTVAIAHTVTLVGALGSVLLGLALTPLLSRWIVAPHFPAVAAVLFCSLPIVAMGQLPLALLERRLAYRVVASIELAGQFLYYAVAIMLARRDYGPWAPVVGWWAQSVLLVVSQYVAARRWPRLSWDRSIGIAIIRSGLTFSTANWVWSLRQLVNPLVVGHFVGAVGVGQVAIAIRITDVLGFMRTAAWRIALSIFGRFTGDVVRIRRVLGEAMYAQAIVLGVIFAAFAVVAPVLVPLALGPAWAPVARIFPYVALGYLANAIFSLHTAALFMIGDNAAVLRFHAVHVALFGVAASIAVSRVGLIGYGYAECVAILSYVLLHRSLVRRIGHPKTFAPLAWGAASALAMFYSALGLPALAGLAILPFFSANRTAFAELIRDVRAARA